MSAQKYLQQAKQLIQHKQYDKARSILKRMPANPTAQQWLLKLDQIAPPPKRSGLRLFSIRNGAVLLGILCSTCTCALLVSASATNEENQNATASIIALTPSKTPTITLTPSETPIPSDTPIPSETPLPSATSPINPVSGTRYVTAINLNVRSGAGAGYESIGILEFADAVEVTGEMNGWYRIEYRDQAGWVSGDFLSTTRPSSATPRPPTNTPRPTVEPQQIAPQQPQQPSGVCSCAGDTLNCSSFGSQSAAQACHDYCMATTGQDVHGLDGGAGDGVACESLP